MEHLPMAQGTFHIITFGCQMNVNDSFWLARSLQRRGFVESPLEKAEVVILNTCSVRDKPEQKVYAALGRIKYETRRVPARLPWSRDAWPSRSARASLSVSRRYGWSWAATGSPWLPTPSKGCMEILPCA